MIQEYFSLKPYNTFGIEVKTRYFATFSTLDELLKLKEKIPNQPLLILGGGSNVLFTKDFEGLVLHNQIKGIQKIEEDEKHIWLKVGAGENWHSFVQYCIAHEYAGVENLSLIPGTVGAAPMQNIGAYGAEIQEVIYSVETLEKSTGQSKTFSRVECDFGYRESVFKNIYKNQFIIGHVIFKLSKLPIFRVEYGAIQEVLRQKGIQKLSIKVISEAICEIRNSKLPNPAVIGNGGSFFKNPEVNQEQYQSLKARFTEIPAYPLENGQVKIPAGWLIEHAGWKGKREGQAGVHEKQALVLVNHGDAKGEDILNLSYKIQASIMEKYNIELNPEINIIH